MKDSILASGAGLLSGAPLFDNNVRRKVHQAGDSHFLHYKSTQRQKYWRFGFYHSSNARALLISALTLTIWCLTKDSGPFLAASTEAMSFIAMA